MRRTIPFLALLATHLVPALPAARGDVTGSAMADAARRFVAALEETQKTRATFTFDSTFYRSLLGDFGLPAAR